MEQHLVSVIVPVYNVEKYIDKCIQSIINQTYKNLEIILVDDGSPDRCPSICDNYAAIDSRITTIHKTNGGLSSARNIGLQEAHGEYLVFVDSDDWIEKNMIEFSVKKLEEHAVDIVSFSAKIIVNDAVLREEFAPFETETVLSAKSATEEILKDRISSQVWLRLYKRNCWKGITFPVGRLYEDLPTTYKVFEKAKHGICFAPVPLYNYLHNNEGISLSPSPNKAYHIYLGLKEHYEYARQHYSYISQDCLKPVVINGLGVINSSLNCSSTFSVEKINDVRAFLRDNKKHIVQLKTISFGRKLILFVYYTSFSLYKFLAKLVLWVRKIKNK